MIHEIVQSSHMPMALDAVVTLMLALQVPLKNRILPIYGTPYWLFAIFFLVLFGYVLVSLFGRSRLSVPWLFRTKIVMLLAIIFIAAVLPTVTAIGDRHTIAPAHRVHDIIIQQEAAMRYLLQGKNPYKETYFGTLLESWQYDEQGRSAVNPALYHFVMPPWYLLSAFPFYFLANRTIGYFDGRMVLLACLFGLVFFLINWWKKKEIGFFAVPLVLLAPGIIDYFIEGRSDTFALFWLVAALYFFDKKHFFLSSLLFGLALISKQTIWFATPFYLVMLYIAHKKNVKRFMWVLLPMVLAAGVFVIPFLRWDAKAYTESTIFYLSGNTPTGYPVSGYGFGMLLYQFGVISNIHAYYPFSLWQAALGIPTLVGMLWFLWKKPVMSRFFLGYGITLFVVWYFSRYFNNSHLGYIANLFTLGMLKHWDESV